MSAGEPQWYYDLINPPYCPRCGAKSIPQAFNYEKDALLEQIKVLVNKNRELSNRIDLMCEKMNGPRGKHE